MYSSECSPGVSAPNLKKTTPFISYSPSSLSLKKEPKKKKSLSKRSLSLSPPSAQAEEFLLELHYAQARQFISQIEDPLWRHVCQQLMKMMGALPVLKIWESRLGDFSAQNSHMEIHCKNEDIAEFVQKYAFVILGSLQHYFPSIKDLKIKVS